MFIVIVEAARAGLVGGVTRGLVGGGFKHGLSLGLPN